MFTQDRLNKTLTVILIVVFFFVLTLSFCFRSNAEELNTSYPYELNNSNINTYTSFASNNSDVVNFLLSTTQFQETAAQYDDYFLFFPEDSSWRENCKIGVCFDGQGFSGNISQGFTTSSVGVSGDFCEFSIDYDGNGYILSSYGFPGPDTHNMFGNTSLVTYSGINGFNDGSYYINYVFYSTSDILYRVGDQYYEIITVGNSNVVNPFEVIAFVPSADLGAFVGASIISNAPQPSIRSWDSSLSADQNIHNILDDIANLIVWSTGKVVDNIVNSVNNLGSNIQNSFNTIKQTIDNGFSFIYNNLTNFFSPYFESFLDSLNYLIEAPDSSEWRSTFLSSQFYTDYSSLKTFSSTFLGVFSNTSEPNSFVIPLHIEDISYFEDANLDTFYLDLSFLNPVKPALRTFFWVVCIYGLIISIIDSLPNYINGGGGEDD